MANVLVEKTNLQDIANAIRNKNASSDKYTPSQMAQAINNIPQSGQIIPSSYYILGNFLQLQDAYGGWIESYTIGSPLVISGYGRTDWRLRRTEIQKQKKYLVCTYTSGGGSHPVIVTDYDDKVIDVIGYNNGRFAGYHLEVVDTENYDDTNGLLLYLGCGNLNDMTYNFNRMPETFIGYGEGFVYCREIKQIGNLQ